MAGFAPRGRRELRRLLDVADLDHAVPSTLWDRTGEGTWVTGIAGGRQPAWQAAAHAAGSVTAWRSFVSEEGDALTLQVVPLATAADADDAVAHALDPNLQFRWAPGADDAGALVEVAAHGAVLVVARAVGPGWTDHDLAEVVAAQRTALG